MNQEYIVVKDETGNAVGKIKVNTKEALQNFAAWIVNGNLVYGYAEYAYMQDLAKDLSLIQESEDEKK